MILEGVMTKLRVFTRRRRSRVWAGALTARAADWLAERLPVRR